MTTKEPATDFAASQVAALGALENRLWRAFKKAEAQYIPSRLNIFKVSANFADLRRKGHLKLHEYYPIYGAASFGFAFLAVENNSFWYFLGYVLTFSLTLLLMSKYERKFAWAATQVHGLERYAFGVDSLPLLVFGIRRIFPELPSDKGDRAAAPLTKENLASVLKLAKCGHEHGEFSYGIGEWLKRLLFGGVSTFVVYLFSSTKEATQLFEQVSSAFAAKPALAAVLGVFALGLGLLTFEFLFGPVNEKRRKRRYLLALNTIHETWTAAAGHGSAEVPGTEPQVAAPAQAIAVPQTASRPAEQHPLPELPASA